MSDLVENLSELCVELEKQYYICDESLKSAAGEEYEKISLILVEVMKIELDKNDATYKEVVNMINRAYKDLEKVRKGIMETDQFVSGIIGIADRLDKMITFFI